jgi:hypothetical protein
MSELDEEKLFYERFYSLVGDKQLFDICNKFGIAVFRRSSVLENFAKIVKEFGFGGTRCVEIGTCNGLTSIVLARHFSEVVTIDIAPNAIRHEIADFIGARNIKFVDINSNAEKRKVIESLKFDGAYVDGDHFSDTRDDFDLVKRCGQVLFHEFWPAQRAVVDLVESLRPNIKTIGKFALWTA